MIRLLKRMRHILRQAPYVHNALRTMHLHRAVYADLAPLWNEVVFIDPRLIRGKMSPKPYEQLRKQTGYRSGAIIGGDWDIELNCFDHTEYSGTYKMCHQRWVEGKEWIDTERYQARYEHIRKGNVISGCRTVDDLKKRYEKLDRIFEDVARRRTLSINRQDLLLINIVRDGSLFRGPDGYHRMSIVLILGLDSIPAAPGFIHADAVEHFQKLRVSST